MTPIASFPTVVLAQQFARELRRRGIIASVVGMTDPLPGLTGGGFSVVVVAEHADRARADHAAGDEGRAGDNQRVERIAVGREGVRHEAVVGRIAHRRVQDAIDEQGAAGLVELVLNRLSAERDFDDDVQAFRRIVADRDVFDAHGCSLPLVGPAPPPVLRRA